MTFLEALYGSNHLHSIQENKSTERARFNGNVYLSVFAVIGLFTLLFFVSWFVPSLLHSLFKAAPKDRWMLKLIIIALMAVCVGIIYASVGTKENVDRHVKSFLEYPYEEQQSAGKKLNNWFYLLFASFAISLFIAMYQ